MLVANVDKQETGETPFLIFALTNTVEIQKDLILYFFSFLTVYNVRVLVLYDAYRV